VQLASDNHSYGCRKLWQLLRLQGYIVNKKKVTRLYRKHQLYLRLKHKVRIKRIKQSLAISNVPNQIWSLDFVHDKLDNGRKIKALTVIDEFNREIKTVQVDSHITSIKLTKILDEIIFTHGIPEAIRSDNGPEFISATTQQWAISHRINWIFIQPGKPTQNAYCERFNGTLRREVLNTHVFSSLAEARLIINAWADNYNNYRPHDSLGGLPPILYKQKFMQHNRDKFVYF